MYVRMYVRLYVCSSVCICVCMSKCMCVCMCVCIHVHMYVCTYSFTWLFGSSEPRTETYARAKMYDIFNRLWMNDCHVIMIHETDDKVRMKQSCHMCRSHNSNEFQTRRSYVWRVHACGMSHATHIWILTNEQCRIWRSHVAYEEVLVLCAVRLLLIIINIFYSHLLHYMFCDQSCFSSLTFAQRLYCSNESYEWFMSLALDHSKVEKSKCADVGLVMSRVWKSHVTVMNELRHTYRAGQSANEYTCWYWHESCRRHEFDCLQPYVCMHARLWACQCVCSMLRLMHVYTRVACSYVCVHVCMCACVHARTAYKRACMHIFLFVCAFSIFVSPSRHAMIWQTDVIQTICLSFWHFFMYACILYCLMDRQADRQTDTWIKAHLNIDGMETGCKGSWIADDGGAQRMSASISCILEISYQHSLFNFWWKCSYCIITTHANSFTYINKFALLKETPVSETMGSRVSGCSKAVSVAILPNMKYSSMTSGSLNISFSFLEAAPWPLVEPPENHMLGGLILGSMCLVCLEEALVLLKNNVSVTE